MNLSLLIQRTSLSTVIMSYNIVKKHFPNKFGECSSEDASVLENNQINRKQRIRQCLQEKWEIIESRFDQLDYRDYSIFTGTAGIALLKLKKGDFDQKKLKEIINLLSLKSLKGRRISFLCGDAGPLAIGAVAYDKLGNKEKSNQQISRLLAMEKHVVDLNSDVPDEILYGRAGYLYSLLFINKNVSPAPISQSHIRKVIDAILQSGQKLAKEQKFPCPLMYEWHDSYYLGAAHGVCGILYMLLQAKTYLTDTEITSLIKPTIDYLITLQFPGGNFPSSLGRETDKLVQWCHGAPGFLFLFSIAYQVYSDKKYLNLALQCGDVVWERGLLKKGYSICHGVSGNAYCFLELFQLTQDIKHLYRAVKFAEWCVDYTKEHEEYSPDRPHSLFEGTAGPMYLLLDIQNPMDAKFPGFAL